MLPDFPDEKELCRELVRKRMKSTKDERMHLFGQSDGIACFEGDKFEIRRADGTCDVSEFQRIEVGREWNIEEIESLTIDALVKDADDMAREFGTQQMKHIIETIDDACERVGHVFKHGKDEGGYLEGFFNSLETVHIDFRDDGSPIVPWIMAGSEAAEKLNRVLEMIDEDPTLKRRYDEIMEQQREKWRARESNRKLVG